MKNLNIFDAMTPGKTVVMILSTAVLLLIAGLNAVFTYSYGTSVIGPFLLADMLAPADSASLSGLVAVLFFDVAYIVALLVLVFACRSVWQYGIVGLQFVITFMLSVGASVISIVVLSPLSDQVGPILLSVARYAGYAGLVGGFVVNAAAGVGYLVTSPRIAEEIRGSSRRARDLAADIKADTELDTQTYQQSLAQIQTMIPALSQLQTQARIMDWLARNGIDPASYALPANVAQTPDPAAPAAPAPVPVPVPVTDPNPNGRHGGRD